MLHVELLWSFAHSTGKFELTLIFCYQIKVFQKVTVQYYTGNDGG